MKGPTLEEVKSHFPYKTLHKVSGPPSLETLTKLQNEVKRNALSIDTTLGGKNMDT